MLTAEELKLKDETIEKLQELIRVNLGSAEALKGASDMVSEANLRELFRSMATDRNNQAGELQKFVQFNGEAPETSGRMSDTFHRTWMEFRGALNGGKPEVILIEAERAEDRIKEAYLQTLLETEGSPIHEVLNRQFDRVIEQHDRVRDLRDAFKAA